MLLEVPYCTHTRASLPVSFWAPMWFVDPSVPRLVELFLMIINPSRRWATTPGEQAGMQARPDAGIGGLGVILFNSVNNEK